MARSFARSLLSLYGVWGFYNGFHNRGNFFSPIDNDSYKYVTNRVCLGAANGIVYVSFLPLSVYLDLLRLEDRLREPK